jgi:hypothetical protein
MGVPVIDMERFKFGQQPGLQRVFFGNIIKRNLISSLLNKVLINFNTIGRHSSGVINN